jgi:cytochrome P450 family 4
LDLNDAGANFTNDEIRDEVVTMMIGVSIYLKNSEVQKLIEKYCKINFQGSETSGITVCFCLLMLAIHQDIQVSLEKEILYYYLLNIILGKCFEFYLFEIFPGQLVVRNVLI